MIELIDRDNAFKTIISECESTDDINAKMAYLRAASIILKMPSEDSKDSKPIRRQGKWILLNLEVNPDQAIKARYQCSACLTELKLMYYPTGDNLPLYCGHCGSCMTYISGTDAE